MAAAVGAHNGERGAHGFKQLFFAVGLGEVAGKPGGPQPLGFAGLGPRGEGHHGGGRPGGVGVLAQGAGGGFAVHAGHPDVREHEVEGAVVEELNGGRAAGRRGHLPAPVAEHGFGHQVVHQVVFHQQHPAGGRGWGRRGRGQLRSGAGGGQRAAGQRPG